MTRRLPRRATGFTFVELLMTLAIMAILAMVALPTLQLAAQRERERELRLALREIRTAIDAYKRASDQGRIPLRIGESGYPRQLSDLVSGIEDQRSPSRQKIYFLRRVPADPMAVDAGEQDPVLTWGVRSYASPPDDPQPGADVFDVFSKSARVGLDGVPYRQW